MNIALGSTLKMVVITINPVSGVVFNLTGTSVPVIRIFNGTNLITPTTAPVITKIPNTVGMYSVSITLDKTKFSANEIYSIISSYTIVGISDFSRQDFVFKTIEDELATRTDVINTVWKTIIDGGKDLRWLATILVSLYSNKVTTSNYDAVTKKKIRRLYNSNNQLLVESVNTYDTSSGIPDGYETVRTNTTSNMTMDMNVRSQ